MYTALYMPARQENEEDPSRNGFCSEESAWEYIFNRMCDGCQKERQLAITNPYYIMDRGDDYEITPSLYPACSCEWCVVNTEQYNKCESFEDLFTAAGYETIYVGENK
jgi:hypothetical protein